MAKQDTYSAKWPMRLDCGHSVAAGGKMVITKIYTCEQDAQRPIHATLAAIKDILEKGVIHLKHLEWDLRHTEQK
jgi:hypothetical protein